MQKVHQATKEATHGEAGTKSWQDAVPRNVDLFLIRSQDYLEKKLDRVLNFDYEVKKTDPLEYATPGKLVVVQIGYETGTYLLTGKAIPQLEECTFSLEDAIGPKIFGKKAGYRGKLSGRKETIILKKIISSEEAVNAFLEKWMYCLNPLDWKNKLLPCDARFLDKINQELGVLLPDTLSTVGTPSEPWVVNLLTENSSILYEYEHVTPPPFAPGRALVGNLLTYMLNGEKEKKMLDTIDTENSISIFSPLGSLLLGRKVGSYFSSIDESNHDNNFFGQLLESEPHGAAKAYFRDQEEKRNENGNGHSHSLLYTLPVFAEISDKRAHN